MISAKFRTLDHCKARHRIENFFTRLKQYRATATRYDKIARNFFAASIVWLNWRQALARPGNIHHSGYELSLSGCELCCAVEFGWLNMMNANTFPGSDVASVR